ncbi:MAG: hypothetical protein ABIR18_01870, partial [Chitinophagaceae bacterium]
GNDVQCIFNSQSADGNFSTTRLMKKADLSDIGGSGGFTLSREAGVISFSGPLANTGGSGEYTFKENAKFKTQLDNQGMKGIGNGSLFILCLTDINSNYLRLLKENGYENISMVQLQNLAFQNLSLELLQGYFQMKATTAMGKISLDQLVAMKTMNVSPQYVNSLRELGYKQLSFDEIMAARTHGVDKEFINSMIAKGYKNLTIEQLIELKVKGTNAVTAPSKEKAGSIN